MKGSLKIWTVILSIVVMGTGITLCTNSYVSRRIDQMEKAEKAEKVEEEAGEEPEKPGREEAVPMEAASRPTEAGRAYQAMPRSAPPETEAEALGGEAVLAETAPDTEVQKQEEVLVQEEAVQEDAGDAGDAEKIAAALAEASAADTAGAAVEIVECPVDLQEALKEYEERLPQIDAQIEQMRRADTENNNMYSVKNAAQTELQIWEREMEGIYRLLCDSLEDTACQVLKKEQQEWLVLRDVRAEEAAKRNSGGSLESVDYIASIAASNRERAYGLLEKYQE